MTKAAKSTADQSVVKIEVTVLAISSHDPRQLSAAENAILFKSLNAHSQFLYLCVLDEHIETNRIKDSFFADFADRIIPVKGNAGRLNCYWEAAKFIETQHNNLSGDIVFCDISIIGPLRPLDDLLRARTAANVHMMSAFCSIPEFDSRFATYRDLHCFCDTSWLQICPRLWDSGIIQSEFYRHRRQGGGNGLLEAEVAICRAVMKPSKWIFDSFAMKFNPTTSLPHILETDHLIAAGHPFLHRSFLMLDPLVFDMQTLDGPRTLETIETHTDFDLDIIWDVILQSNSLRDIETNFEEIFIIDEGKLKRKNDLQESKFVMVCHVYYIEFIKEIIYLFRFMPINSYLFISVSSEENKKLAESIISRKKIVNFEVKVVAKNQGRDMSSLFITFQKEFLTGGFDLALRIHSKKTPQVALHISNSFRQHLFENLIKNRAYVQRVIRLFEDHPKIGLVIPPTIHIGFGTLGHSWFSNRAGTEAVAHRLGLAVKLDDHTPVAPYGTMFWFRPKALAPMFAENWKWSEFNPEPNHIDGGLAHIMERLIGYVVQSQGYRVVHAINRRQAERNYVKLQYKLQRLAAAFPSADIRQQIKIANSTFGPVTPIGASVWHRWTILRTKIKRNHPSAWQTIRPILKIGRVTFLEMPRLIRLKLSSLGKR